MYSRGAGHQISVIDADGLDNANLRMRATWNAELDRARIVCNVSDAARNEVLGYWRAHSKVAPGGDLRMDSSALPLLREELGKWRHRVERRERMVLVEEVLGLDFHERRAFGWLVANLLGAPLVQNDNGDRVVSVWPRPDRRRIIDGARYHQTREGGGLHTDNVNVPEPWEYLVFCCIRPAFIGGESILVSALSVHDELLAVPNALEILRRPFWWEYRGIADAVFQAPVITYNDDGEPRFRYLRKYLESAHRRAAVPLTDEQVWALDVFDAILELSHLQYRVRLEQGEILITYDSQVLHARTFFCDPSPQMPADTDGAAASCCRFFDRVWVKSGE